VPPSVTLQTRVFPPWPDTAPKPAALLAGVQCSADEGPGLVVLSPSLRCLFSNAQASQLMRALRQYQPRGRMVERIPANVIRCCRELLGKLAGYPDPKTWSGVQATRVLGDGNPVVARFYAIPTGPETARVSVIVGVLERIDVSSASCLAPSEDFNFSDRERACVIHLAQGMTDKEIARQLGISEYTVKDHFKQVRKKTGAANRAGIIARVLGRAPIKTMVRWPSLSTSRIRRSSSDSGC
jgi:DNA-binding CsgD family transcriptional regulator